MSPEEQATGHPERGGTCMLRCERFGKRIEGVSSQIDPRGSTAIDMIRDQGVDNGEVQSDTDGSCDPENE